MTERLVYPLDEVREMLGGVCRTTLYKMRDRGEIRFVKIGRRSMVPAEDIRRLLEQPLVEDEPDRDESNIFPVKHLGDEPDDGLPENLAEWFASL